MAHILTSGSIAVNCYELSLFMLFAGGFV